MKKNSPLTQIKSLAALAAIGLAGFTAQATPYASGVSVSGGSVSFTLNESADLVKVIFGTTTNVIGPLAKGSYTTNVSAVGTVYVEVSKSSGAGWQSPAGSNFTHTVNGVSVSENWAGKLQISDDANPLTRYNSPRGIAVNTRPASPYFGRVYVGNSATGTPVAGRTIGRGFFTLKADLSDSPNGYGNTAQSGGLTNYWSVTTSASVPWMLSIGDDDNLYVTDFVDASSVVARVNPNLLNGERVLDYVGGPSTLPVGQNHGSLKKVIATGTLAGGNLKLFTLDEDYTGDCMNSLVAAKNSFWRYDVDAGPLTNQSCGTFIGTPTPSWTTTGTQDFALGTNGYIYAIQNRSAGGEAGLYVIEVATGATVWNSRTAYQTLTGIGTDNDVLVNLQSIAISPDNKYIAINLLSTGNPSGSDCWIIPLAAGIPQLANRMVLDSGAVTQGRGVAFDLANNLYTVSSGDAVVRVFSPGGFTKAVTGTDGSFNLLLPSTTVSVVASPTTISEGGAATFTLTRVGNAAVPLTVNYQMSGTAVNGSDYATLSGSVTFKVGDSTTNVTLTAAVDGVPEVTELATLSLLTSPDYSLDTPSSAAVTILDTSTPTLQVAANIATMYERHTNDYAGVALQRLGDISQPLIVDVTNLVFAGTAVKDVDYVVLSNSFPISIDPGLLVTNINVVSPYDNSAYTGNKTIIVSLAASAGPNGFGVATTNTTLTILDDENPAAQVLYTNALTSLDDGTNWNVTYANGDMAGLGGSDYEASFGYDLTTSPGGVIAAPPGGANNALRVTVNKLVASNAGMNAYPTNVSFSGDFAVRFNMNVIIDTAAGTTQGPLIGINHDGTQTNWWAGSGVVSGGPWAADGIWYWLSADGGAAAGDYILHTGTGGVLPNTGWTRPITAADNLTFAKMFKGPPAPYSGYAGPGLVANDPPAFAADNRTWTDVEIKQVGRTISLYLNKTRVLNYSNTTSFTSGKVMFGYDDPFNSVGEASGAAYFANLSVVRLTAPLITSIVRSGNNVTIQFSSNDGTATAGSYALQSATDVSGPYADVSGATITQLPAAAYQATATSTTDTRFYRIRVR